MRSADGVSDKPSPEGLRIVPEVAVDYPRISPNRKTYTFTLRPGFRFSDGTPVRASAFARAINRTLAPGIESAALQYTGFIAGAADVRAGRSATAAGRRRARKHASRPVHTARRGLRAQTTMPFFCAVPPNLPSDPEGVRTFHSAGPYVITDYRPGERVTIRRNPYYGGSRPHHVDGFDVELRVDGQADALDRVERGEADWTSALGPTLLRTRTRIGREVRGQQVALLRASGQRAEAHRLQQRTSVVPR